MKNIALLLLLSIASSCALQSKSSNKYQDIYDGKGYISPNQLVEVEMLIRDNKKENFSPDIYVGRGVLKPGSIVPVHTHIDSDEILIFKSGGGELIIDGNVIKVKTGQTIYIPKGVKHSYSNRSKFKAEYIQIYSPKGPEKKFLKWAPK